MSPSHALTHVGKDFNRRAYYRRDANCPAFLLYRKDQRSPLEKASAWVVNLSEGDILLLVDEVAAISPEVYVVLPLIKAKFPGKVARQGEHTIAVQFKEPVPSEIIDRIASIEAKRLKAKA